MDFKPTEILTYVMPGIYLLGVTVLLIDIFTSTETLNFVESEGAAALTLFAVPVIGYVWGYIINYLGSLAEHHLYTRNLLSRPSRNILNDSAARCRISNLTDLRSQLNVSGNLDNARALEALTKAKQNMSSDAVEIFHSKSVFGRNILTANVMLLIGSAVPLICAFVSGQDNDKGISLIVTGALILLTIILYQAWRRSTHVYIKYVFVNYLHRPSDHHDRQHP